METPALPPPLPAPEPESVRYRFSKTGVVLAVVVIAACAWFVLRMNAQHQRDATPLVKPNQVLELLARYAVGLKGLLESTGQKDAGLAATVMRDVKTVARGEADELRTLLVKGWLNDTWPAEAELNALAAKNEDLRQDVAALGQLKATQGKAAEDVWRPFLKRHGWIAKMARAQAGGANDPARQEIVQQAIGTTLVLIGGTSLGMLAAVGGLVLMILAIVRWRSGRLRLTLERRDGGHGGVLMEGFALYLALFLFLPPLVRELPLSLPRWSGYVVAMLSLIVGMGWPLLRGMRGQCWRESMGLHGGQGLLREMGAGILGWLAALPLIVAGMIAASWITKMTGQFPSHPIVEVFAGDGWAKFGAIMLAVVWAPVSEELMFRGLLFPGLSAWLRWVPGMLVSAFVFAVIHPQGWAGVPAIMALAAAFSLLRMWRQSLIAPMTAHALNNGLMCAMMLLLW
jgi:membrane protease YdiL (CAAX protease family)